MSRVALWFDGGGAYGFGNIRRSRELGETLAARGHNVAHVPLSPLAASLSGSPGSQEAAADVVVVDAPRGAEAAVARAKAVGAKVIALDYEGSIAPDLIISLQEPSGAPRCRVLWGLDFAIIRREIRDAAAQGPKSNEVIVMVGGGDVDGTALRVAEKLRAIPVCVVQGPAGSRLHAQGGNVRIVHDPPDLPRLMAGCRWAVTTGGTTMLEMLFLGKAVHVVPRTQAEIFFAKTFAERGALLGVGLDSLGVPDDRRLRDCETSGPQIIDGRGCERIVAALESLL